MNHQCIDVVVSSVVMTEIKKVVEQGRHRVICRKKEECVLEDEGDVRVCACLCETERR